MAVYLIIAYGLAFLISCAVLVSAGSKVTRGLIKIARFLRWEELVVSSFIMAFATTLPEFFVNISSVIHKRPEIGLGNIIGSNIILLTLVIGISALMAGRLRFRGRIISRASMFAAIAAVFPLILMADNTLSRFDGVLLILFSVFYFYWLLSEKKKGGEGSVFNHQKGGLGSFFKGFGDFFIGIILLLASAEGIVWSASSLAVEINLPLFFLGMFLIAFGTSIPEIVFAIKAASSGHREMIIGDAVGATVVNSTVILGTTVLLSPIVIDNFLPYIPGVFFAAITAILFAFFARTDKEITRKEAIVLLFVYTLFVTVQIFVK